MKRKVLSKENKKADLQSSNDQVKTKKWNTSKRDIVNTEKLPNFKSLEQQDEGIPEKPVKGGTLPNVKVLMKSYALSHDNQETEHKSKDSAAKQEENSVVHTVQGGSTEWYEGMTLNCQEQKSSGYVIQERKASYTENTPTDTVEEYESKLKTLDNNSLGEVQASNVVSLVSEPIPSKQHFQNLETASFAEDGHLASHPHTEASIHQLHPLTPVVMPSTERLHEEDMVSDNISTNKYHYPNHTCTWEQENDRYAEFAWKNPNVYYRNTYANGNIIYTNNNNNNGELSLADSNIALSNCDDTSNYTGDGSDSYEQGYYSEVGSTKLSITSGRRRRKRVQTPVQRTAANMRERRRMCHLNVAFDRLKDHLPNVKDKRKLSRIQTLKAAIYYIHLLRDSLNL